MRSRWSGWAKWILLGGVAISAGFFLLARAAQRGRAQARFDAATLEARARLENRLRNCEDLLRGVRGFAQSGAPVTRESFRTYLRSLDLEKRYPGLQAVASGVPLGPAGGPPGARRLQAEHRRPELRIHPSGDFGDDAIILFEEPEEPNLRALGFNSSSTAGQRASLVATRDTGELRASPPVALAQAPLAGPGLVLRLAVYGGGRVPETLEARRRAFVGYANAIFLLKDLSADSMARLRQDGVTLQLSDLDTPEKPTPFLKGGGGLTRRWWQRFGPPGLMRQESLEIGGRSWELRFEADRTFFQAGEVSLPWIILFAGLQITLLLGALIHSISLTGLRARELATKMTEELRRSESRLRAITRVLPDSIIVLDDEGRYLEILTADDSRMVAPAAQLLGRKVDDVLPPELAHAVHATIHFALLEWQIQSLEYGLDTPKGRLRMEARVAPVDVGAERRPCVIWVARDVTERHAQEEMLRQTQKLESLGLLAGGIAHDFNNLLAAIQGHLSLARLVVADGESPEEQFDRMDATIQRASGLARQLLAYSGRDTLQIAPMDLNALVEEMVELLGVSRSKKIHLDVRLSEGLPLIEGDHVQLQQVVMNLVINANEAIGDQTGTVELATGFCRLEAQPAGINHSGEPLKPGEYITLLVRDSGSGMTPDTLSRIFDPFFTTKPKGRGLGLSAIRGILRSHRAGLEIHSQVGEGTSVALYFPALKTGEIEQSHAKLEAGTFAAMTGIILLAEDEATIRETSRAMAERLGFEVIEAADGEEAWTLFQANRSRLRGVVLDLTMPRRGGLEVYGLIRKESPSLPVVLCSGYSREEVPKPLDAREPRAFLQKPFTFRQFEAALREVLERPEG
jgi:PAS domain S-box-containing protein